MMMICELSEGKRKIIIFHFFFLILKLFKIINYIFYINNFCNDYSKNKYNYLHLCKDKRVLKYLILFQILRSL